MLELLFAPVCPSYDFRHPIRFRSSKEGPDHFVQDWPRSDLDVLVRFWPNASGPDPIWMSWPGFGQTHLVWKQAGVQESSGPGFWQNATSPLPVFHFQSVQTWITFLHRGQNQPGSFRAKPARIVSCKTSPDHIVQKTSTDRIVQKTSPDRIVQN